jgi:predicted nucleic acid-binding Zn finger protein
LYRRPTPGATRTICAVKSNGETWDIDADLWQCCCPDYLYRAANRVGNGLPPDCKHVRALKAALTKCPILI